MGAKLQHIKVQGLACKNRRNTGVQLQFTQALAYAIAEIQ